MNASVIFASLHLECCGCINVDTIEKSKMNDDLYSRCQANLSISQDYASVKYNEITNL